MDILVTIIGIVAVSLLVAAGSYIYYQKIRRFKPSEYGTEDFQSIAKYEFAEWRDRAYEHGITRSEWQQVLMRQSDTISTELKRRGIEGYERPESED